MLLDLCSLDLGSLDLGLLDLGLLDLGSLDLRLLDLGRDGGDSHGESAHDRVSGEGLACMSAAVP